MLIFIFLTSSQAAYSMEWELFTSSVERDAEKLLHASNTHTPKYFFILNIELSNRQLVQEAILPLPRRNLTKPCSVTRSDSLLGRIVSQDQFPEWKINYEDYFLTSILHDIGVVPKYHLTTSMSFELKGAMVSHQFITEKNGSLATADVMAQSNQSAYWFCGW